MKRIGYIIKRKQTIKFKKNNEWIEHTFPFELDVKRRLYQYEHNVDDAIKQLEKQYPSDEFVKVEVFEKID